MKKLKTTNGKNKLTLTKIKISKLDKLHIVKGGVNDSDTWTTIFKVES